MSYKWSEKSGFSLARLFKIPYDLWINIVYLFGKELHQPYSEVCQMPFFEIEMILEKFKEDVDNQNKQSAQQNKDYEMQMAENRSMMESMTKNLDTDFKMPSMPQMPNIPGL